MITSINEYKKYLESIDKPTCLFLHGIGAKPEPEIKEMLEKQCNLVYPKLDYGNVKSSDGIYQNILMYDILKDNKGKIDLIIGHSMGGYLAYYLAKELNIPALIINPAFDEKEYYIHVSDTIKPHTPKILAIVGLQDDVISPEIMLKYLEETENCEVWKEQEMGHDISLDMLENCVKYALRKNHITESIDPSWYLIGQGTEADVYSDGKYAYRISGFDQYVLDKGLKLKGKNFKNAVDIIDVYKSGNDLITKMELLVPIDKRAVNKEELEYVDSELDHSLDDVNKLPQIINNLTDPELKRMVQAMYDAAQELGRTTLDLGFHNLMFDPKTNEYKQVDLF